MVKAVIKSSKTEARFVFFVIKGIFTIVMIINNSI